MAFASNNNKAEMDAHTHTATDTQLATFAKYLVILLSQQPVHKSKAFQVNYSKT